MKNQQTETSEAETELAWCLRDRRLVRILMCVFAVIHLFLFLWGLLAVSVALEGFLIFYIIYFPIAFGFDLFPALESSLEKAGLPAFFAVLFILGTGMYASCGFILGKTIVVIRRSLRNRAAENSCQNCRYNLTGNVSGKCPECGTPTGQVEIQDTASLHERENRT